MNAGAARNVHLKERASVAVAKARLTDRAPKRCSECRGRGHRDQYGEWQPIKAHHEDYAKPLDVVWLCGTCHRGRHEQIKREQMAVLAFLTERSKNRLVREALERFLSGGGK